MTRDHRGGESTVILDIAHENDVLSQLKLFCLSSNSEVKQKTDNSSTIIFSLALMFAPNSPSSKWSKWQTLNLAIKFILTCSKVL